LIDDRVPSAVERLSCRAPLRGAGRHQRQFRDPEENRHYIMYLFSGGGYGGWWQTDGLTNGCSSVGISKTQPVEILEQHYPILFDRYALHEGSGGAGRHNGGGPDPRELPRNSLRTRDTYIPTCTSIRSA